MPERALHSRVPVMEQRSVVSRRRSLWAAALVGAALVADVDQIVFHQLLTWHHFYDAATPDAGVVSDGILHATVLVVFVVGVLVLLGLARRGAFTPPWAWAGGALGGGAFQLFDGTVNHGLLRLHRVRYVDDPLPYDLAWNGAALVLLAIGLLLLLRARRIA